MTDSHFHVFILLSWFLICTPGGGVVSTVYADDGGPEEMPEAEKAPEAVTAPEAPWSLSVDLELDGEGLLSQRSMGNLQGHRVVWWSRGAVVLSREEAAPAGMVERQYRLHNPLDETVHRAGAAVGPLVIGPVDPQGVYRRVLDPSTGGVVPASAGQSARGRLDSSRNPSSWEGIFLSTSSAAEAESQTRHVGSVAPFAAGGGYLHNPDRARLLLGRVESAPAGGRFGGVILTAGSAEGLSDGVPALYRPQDEAWVYNVSPLRRQVYRSLGLSYLLDRGRFGDALWPWRGRCFVLAEGWRQFYAYRPVCHAVNVVVSVGVPECTISARTVLVEPGYLDVDMTPPLRNGFSGVRAEGRLNLPEGRRRNRPFLEWRGESSGDRRWDDGVPSEELRMERSFFLAYRSGGWIGLLKGEVTARRDVPDSGNPGVPSPLPSSLMPSAAVERSGAATVSVAVGPPRRFSWRVEPTARGSCRYSRADGRRHWSTEFSLTGRDAGVPSWKVGWKTSLEETDRRGRWVHGATMDITLRRGVTLSARFSVEEPGTTEAVWSGLLRLGLYRSGTLGGTPSVNAVNAVDVVRDRE
jgi:hypothetical protein